MRIALGCTPSTQAEVAAVVELVRTMLARGDGPDVELVVPALDRAAISHALAGLAPLPECVRVEPVHEYLARGHDIAALVSDDPIERGRSFAAVIALLTYNEPVAASAITPGQLVAWLARNEQLRVPDALSPPPRRGRDAVAALDADHVIVRTRWGTNLIALAPDAAAEGMSFRGSYDPSVASGLVHLLRKGDTAVDASAGIGGIAVHMAKLVGCHGRALAIEADATTRALLEENIELNGVSEWMSTDVDLSALNELFIAGAEVALLRAEASDCAPVLHSIAEGIDRGLVQRLLLEFEPDALADTAGLVALLRSYRRKLGASFATLELDGSLRLTSLDELLHKAEAAHAVVVELVPAA